jgi:NADP-dependent 3-hydroxy acid dehydrogenase YdfG
VNIQGKIAFITGASSGIGKACAEKLAQQKCHLILNARRADRLQQLKTDLETQFGIEAYLAVFDLRNKEMVQQVVEELPPRWKTIDFLINNAGLALGKEKIHHSKMNDMDTVIDTNIKSVLYLSKEIIPLMQKNNEGHIVNIGSIAGHEVYEGGAVYCATKHAVNAITKGMRLDLLGSGIKVSAVDPGFVDTEFSRVRFDGDDQKVKAVYAGMMPLTGDDIADTVVFTLSRPKHVQIAEIIILPTDQANATSIYRQ